MKHFIYLLLLIGFWSYGQEVRVIDNKGTIHDVTVNSVTVSSTAPTDPVEADIWIDISSTTSITKIWDGETPGSWIEVDAQNARILQDLDGDTTVSVEQTADEDIIRFGTGSRTANRQMLRIDNPGTFAGNSPPFLQGVSAVLGLEDDGSGQFDGRFRITAGNDDSFDDSQGASIDLHGNDTTANSGQLDLVGGSTASGTTAAIRFWGNDGSFGGFGQAERMVITGEGNVGIGTTAPSQRLDVDGSLRVREFIFDQNNESGNPGELLSATATGTDWIDASSVGTDSQTLAFGATNTTTETTLEITDGNSLTLQASGGLTFSQTGTHTLELTVRERDGSTLVDRDGDTKIEVETGTADDDIIRFYTGGTASTERLVIDDHKIEPKNTGNSVFLGENAGANDDLSTNENVFIGYKTGEANTAGARNTSVGASALKANSTGTNNSAFGHQALLSNTTGFSNTAMGYAALDSNTTGRSNTAIGVSALGRNSSGSSNIAIGLGALEFNSTGRFNIAIGRDAGSQTTGNGSNMETGRDNIFIGYASRPLGSADINEIVIGNEAVGIGSNTVVLGNDNITTTALKGSIGMGTTTPTQRLDVDGSLRVREFIFDQNNQSGTPGEVLSATATGTDWIDANSVGTDSQTLAFGATNTTTETTLEITDGNSLTLQASGGLVFTQTGTHTLEMAVAETTGLADDDGDTTVSVEQTADEDIIRFGTGNNTANRQMLRIDNPGTFAGNIPGPSGGTGVSAVLGLEDNGSGQYDGRFRITAGNDDSFDDSQGASIDLHGNDTTANSGQLDLVGGSTASGTTAAIRFWGNDGSFGGFGQAERMVITGEGNVGIGTTAPSQRLDVDGSLRVREFIFDQNNESGNPGELLSATATGTDWIDANSVGTDSQTLAFGATNTTTETTLEITDGNSLTLQASGGLVFTQTGTHTLEMAVADTIGLADNDGDTTVSVERNADEDIIRFGTGNNTANRQMLRIDNPGTFAGNIPGPSGGTGVSAVLGLEDNGSGQYDGRFRITAGNDDSFDDSQGASIDLHGNDTTANSGQLDLVGGSTASGTTAAIRFWGNDGFGAFGVQAERMVITGQGNVGIGNTTPNANTVLDLTNTDDRALLLPSSNVETNVNSPTDGMLIYASSRNTAYLRADNIWKPMNYNVVTNEMFFDGKDDGASTTDDDFYYVSFVRNGDWQVIRYNKSDVNDEKEATVNNNSSQTTQPTTAAICVGLTYN